MADERHIHIHLREVTYPANLLSLARIGLLVPALATMGRPDTQRQALVWLGSAMLTDALDGLVARFRHEESDLGKILDPIADKLVIDLTAIRLSQVCQFPWWATGLLLARDVGILAGGLHIYRRQAHITTSQWAGKATTVALTLAMLLYLLDGERSGKPALYVALLPFSASLWQYGHSFVRALRNT